MKAFLLPEKIQTQRLELKKHRLDLAEAMFAAVEHDRARLRRFLPWVDETRTLEDERHYIRFMQEEWQLCRHFDYGLHLRFPPDATSAFVGNLGVFNLEWSHDRCELGYWLLGAYEGQGYMSEAVRAVEKLLFDKGFNRIEIRCSDLNARSAAIPERLHYTLEGTLRQAFFDQGAYHNLQIYAKLRYDQ